MKRNNIYKGFCYMLLLLIVVACETPNMDKDVTYNNGLLNFYVKIIGESTEYAATKTGPYADGDTLYIKVPTTEESPLNLSQLKPYASLENNSSVFPGIDGIMDFTNPLKINVTDGLGIQRTNYVKILPTPPKTLFKKMWFKNSTEMGVVRPYISGIAVSGNNLLVHDAGDGVRVFDKLTGEKMPAIISPATYTMQVKTDDVGHILINRYNKYGAGFIVYYYEDVNSQPNVILNYTAAAGCPSALGTKMSITGNLKEGKAYIYATAPTTTEIYYWIFNNGVLVNIEPQIIKYANAKSPWTYASVKRESIADNSDHYITYCIYDAADGKTLKKGSRFEIFPPNMDLIQMNTQNNKYKIFDFDVFTINGDKFLVTLEQGFSAWDGVVMKVFEITNKNNLTLVPGDANYSQFKLFESDVYGGTNYNRYGDVAVKVDGLNAYIYASIACSAADKAGIIAYKMTYFPQ